MSTAHQWISEYEENEEQGVEIHVYNCLISFKLSNCFAIEYKEMGEWTQVKCENEKEETTVKGNMIHAFCQDFNKFLINRKEVLNSLKVYCAQDNLDIQILECMEVALKSRSDKFRVKDLHLDKFVINQQIALLKLMNPEVMTSIYFKTQDIEEAVSFLVEWNKGCRLDVKFKCDSFSIEILSSLKKTLNYPSTFSRICWEHEHNNGWTKERMFALLKPFKPSVYNWKMVSFNMKDPSENLVPTEQIDRLSLRDSRLLEVFANPLLMELILKEIECFDMQCLRRVSRDIRSCIDTLKPDPHIEIYGIEPKKSNSTEQDTFDVAIKLRNGERRCLRYQRKELLHNRYDWDVDYFVNCGDQLIERVVNDFKVNIEHQKSEIDHLDLKCHGKMFELIGNILKSKETPLKVKELRMIVTNEKDIMNILPCLGSVDNIFIHFDSDVKLNLTKISKLDQWRNAFNLGISYCTIMDLIQELNIINFRRIRIKINSISSQDVIYLKENLVKSSDFDSFNISSYESLIDENFDDLMPPYEAEAHYSTWYFPMSDPQRFLHLTISEANVIFRAVDRTSVPDSVLNNSI